MRGCWRRGLEIRAPFSPETVVHEFAGVLKSYGLSKVTGDRYAGVWPGEEFRKHGIVYETSERTKSEIYLEALPLINGGRVDLLDGDRLVAQICGLERRVTRGGRDSVDHPARGFDDLANAALGVLVMCRGRVATSALSFARIVVGSRERADPRTQFPWTVERDYRL